jgi:glycosyltransferase involved in cell wall biosynthesis
MSLVYIGNFLGSNPGFYSGPNQWIVDTLIKSNYDVKYGSKKFGKIARIIDMLKIILLNRKKADLVLLDTYSSQAFYFALLVSFFCRLFKLKYVVILHGGDLPTRYKNSPKLSILLLKNAQVVIAPSDYLKQKTSEAFGIEPIIIRNPIELNLYHFRQREIIEPVLLWVRSFQEVYNPFMAIQVVEKLKVKYPNVRLYFVGPDKSNMLPEIKSRINTLKLEKNVVIMGKMSVIEWLKFSEECNIFINTTHKDNTPVSVLEAMALGLPVVSTRVGGIPYLLNENFDGLCCNDNDFEDMAKKIELLIGDFNLVKNITNRAKFKIDTNYDGEIIFNQWVNLIESI